MININELRQSLGAVQPEEVSELLNRLEEAEADALEQARLNGMGAEREMALMAKLEAAEMERDELRTELKEVRHEVAMTANAINTLQAKIEALERQAPVDLNFMELRNSAQEIVESYIYFRRFIANTPLENDIAALMVCFVFAQLDAKGE